MFMAINYCLNKKIHYSINSFVRKFQKNVAVMETKQIDSLH